MAETDGIPKVFSLTDLTGKEAGKDRTVIIATFEVSARYAYVAIIAFLPSVLFASMLIPFFGTWSLALVAVFEVGLVVLYERRSTKGLKQRTYKTLLDSIKSGDGTVQLCGKEISVNKADVFWLVNGATRVDEDAKH